MEDEAATPQNNNGNNEKGKFGYYQFEGRDPKLVKGMVSMISGCHDNQVSVSYEDIDAKEYTGALTSSFLETVCEKKMSIFDFVRMVREKVDERHDLFQLPMFSSSTKIDMDTPFDFIFPFSSSPTNNTGTNKNKNKISLSGTKRGVVIGITYQEVDAVPTLNGGHSDSNKIKTYLIEKGGFQEENITMIMDDGEAISPTRENILSNLIKMAEAASQPGDYCFLYYYGHGNSRVDKNSDEKDCFDETLCPVDGREIIDDELFEKVVCQLKEGVTFFALVDACRSGTCLDLPYSYHFIEDKYNDDLEDMRVVVKFSGSEIEEVMDLNDPGNRRLIKEGCYRIVGGPAKDKDVKSITKGHYMLERKVCKKRDEIYEETQQDLGLPILRRIIGDVKQGIEQVPEERILMSLGSFSTFGFPSMITTSETKSNYTGCSELGVLYYEIEVLKVKKFTCAQFGFCTPGGLDIFDPSGSDGVGCGDTKTSWAVCGFRKELWNDGKANPLLVYEKWKSGDVIGLGVNVNEGKISMSVNGSNAIIIFEDEAIQTGLFPCFSIGTKSKLRLNTTPETFVYNGPSSEVWSSTVIC